MTTIDTAAPAHTAARRLEGRIAVVTGGGAGIGAAICRRFAAEGAMVAVLDLALDGARETVAAMGGGLAIAADVSDSAAVERALADAERDLGPLDILVNNAGAVGVAHVKRIAPRLAAQREERAQGAVETPLDALIRLSDEEWRQILAVHLDGTFYGTRAAARSMAARGRGAIVNMASICGLEGCAGHPHYSAEGRDPRLHTVRREGADRPGRAGQRGRARFRRHESAQGRARRRPTRGDRADAGGTARHARGDRGNGGVPRVGRRGVLRRRDAEPQRRARHGGLTP